LIHGIRIGGKQAQIADDCLAGDRSQHKPDWNGNKTAAAAAAGGGGGQQPLNDA
jgi:hypothetical protein